MSELVQDTLKPNIDSPGEFLKSFLEEKNIKRSELAIALKRPCEYVDDIICGRKKIDTAVALELKKALGTPAQLWLEYDQEYQKQLESLTR